MFDAFGRCQTLQISAFTTFDLLSRYKPRHQPNMYEQSKTCSDNSAWTQCACRILQIRSERVQYSSLAKPTEVHMELEKRLFITISVSIEMLITFSKK